MFCHQTIKLITWRAFDLQNWSTKLLYMVKIGHFVTQMSYYVTYYSSLMVTFNIWSFLDYSI